MFVNERQHDCMGRTFAAHVGFAYDSSVSTGTKRGVYRPAPPFASTIFERQHWGSAHQSLDRDQLVCCDLATD